ncbi:polysaccharide deacetylase family protein [Variovorax paradoxus]|uniref:polysaccharide deacetylase family protein n=1 Tax=Variovorax paradoxus TaxID=34073 RepID=UPI0038D0C96B
MRSASKLRRRTATGLVALLATAIAMPAAWAQAPASCEKPVYLTFDTGHMGIAPLVAEVLKRQQVHVTFFAAAERTQTEGDSLDNHWAAWWKARAAEGHEFGSHTYDHVYWRGDLKGVTPSFRVKPSAGALAGREFTWSAAEYCANIRKASERLELITGKKPLPLYRAPGGKTSPKLLAAARDCGYAHVGWAPAGFLGDELPSEKFSNEKLLTQALDTIRPGDILLAHLGIWSRKDPWAPANLEPLIVGLKAKGFCFQTLRQHPDYRAWIASHP